MPGAGESLISGILAQQISEESSVIATLFDSKNMGRLKMTTEILPELLFPVACLGLISQRFNSKVLKDFAKELFLLYVSKERKGRLELVEATIASRRRAESEED